MSLKPRECELQGASSPHVRTEEHQPRGVVGLMREGGFGKANITSGERGPECDGSEI